MEDLELQEEKTEQAESPEAVEDAKETPLYPMERTRSWSAFIEGDVANFFTGYKLEKMTLEDGNGNKAKLARTKEGAIKIDYTTSVTI